MSVVVLGIGNILLRDEGIGVRVVQELERRYHCPANVEIVDGGTSGIELLPQISGKDLLIIIDAVKSGSKPGTVSRADEEEVPATFRHRISPHQLGLSDLLATATFADEMPKKLVLFGIEPGSMETGLKLTEEVAAAMERLIGLVADELAACGYPLIPLAKSEMEAPSIWATG